MSTLEERLGPGAVRGEGEKSSYRRVAAGPGEPRLLRRELFSEPGELRPGRRRSLLHIAHVTDMQLADVASPGRFEFFESLRGLPGTGAFIPAQRPQESLAAYAIDATLRRIERAQSQETGAPVDLVVSTGDAIDNAQWNELLAYLALLGGGEVALFPGGRYAGVQQRGESELYWQPEGGGDLWRRQHGFPVLPGLLDRAARPFAAGGSSLAWLSCFGNHEGLAFGESVPTAAYRRLLLGSTKAHSLPPGLEPLGKEEELFSHPEAFLCGPSFEVPADPDRRVVGRREYVAAHLTAPGRPAGHGLGPANLADATTYFAYDAAPAVRLIVLDTANLDGDHEGSLGARQFAWLEGELESCHTSWLDAEGRRRLGPGPDRLVVLASHHGLSSLTNSVRPPGGIEPDRPRVGREELRRLLERFPNVVSWLNGHRHLNEIVAHRSRARGPGGSLAGYFEISTAAIADWPSQGRLVELVANEDGTLSILTTMLDHAGPASPGDEAVPADGSEQARDWLASLHRELAANVPGAGFGSKREGRSRDRNCELLVSLPFPLESSP